MRNEAKRNAQQMVVVKAKDLLTLAEEVINSETHDIWVSARNGKFNIKTCNAKGLLEKMSGRKDALLVGCDDIFFIFTPKEREELLNIAKRIIKECGEENGLVFFTKGNGRAFHGTIDKRDIKKSPTLKDLNSVVLA